MRQIRDRNYIYGSILDDYSLFVSKMAREVPPPFVWCCEAAYFKRQKPLAHRLERPLGGQFTNRYFSLLYHSE